MAEGINELTFAGWLAEFTAVRRKQIEASGRPVIIATASIEERQVDAAGRVRRCDVRFSSVGGRKLASGELKRPEVPDGRDPRNENLVSDARRKAIARGLPYYFTCNFAKVILYSVANRPGEDDLEVGEFDLAPIATSGQAGAYRDTISERWMAFLDFLDDKLIASGRTRPTVTTKDVIALRDAISGVAHEVLPRASRRLRDDPTLVEQGRQDAMSAFGFPVAFDVRFPDKFQEELLQLLKFGVFVVTQKLILYRVLEDAGPRRAVPFTLDPLQINAQATDPNAIRASLNSSFNLAIRRSLDYETAFVPEPLLDLVFSNPADAQETAECVVGSVWATLLAAVKAASWLSISQNIVGMLYEVIVEERFRHQLGQFYTPEDVADLLNTFAVRAPGNLVLDPASGGGSFLRSAYRRKVALGESHESSLATLWGFEITAFAAELSTVTLASSNTHEPASYPRIILTDFFDARPGQETDLEVPDVAGRLAIPPAFDAVVGNPPYISYRRITNQGKILAALVHAPETIALPKFSGKSDAFVWFTVHATQFLRHGGRLAFVVSSAILFSDYGIPLIQFLGRHYRICAVIDSMVERWFPDADTNAVLLFLERETDGQCRARNEIRFIRLRRPLAQLLPDPSAPDRREALEQLIALILGADPAVTDPRLKVNLVPQGTDGGLTLNAPADENDLDDDEDQE